jgi:hypothetical protein
VLSAYCAWRYTRPGLRRTWLMVQLLWGGALTALVTAPQATAAGFTNAVGWTGITDTTGQPIGSYFIGTVSMLEAVREQGSDVSMLDPSSWVPGLADRVQIALTYSQLATLLGLCCGFLVVVAALGIWFIKFALGSVWLGWLGALAAPIAVSLAHFVQSYNIFPLAIVICLAVGGILCYWRGFATGAAVMVSAYLVLLLIWVFLRDPVDELVGDHGLLASARSVGFEFSLGVGNNGSLAGGNVDAQTTVLSQWMATVLVRHPIQIANFGEVIDNYAGCAEAWNAALNRGSVVAQATGQAGAIAGAASGPVDAMQQCGHPTAVAHARQLSGETIGLMFFMNCIVLVLLMLLCYIGMEVIRIGFLTFWHLLVLIPAAAVAVAPGPQRQYAKRTAIKLLVHAVEMMFATAGFGVVLVIMSHVTGNTLPGMNIEHPIMKMIVMLLMAAAAVFGFRALMRGFGDQGLPGPMTMAKRTMQMGMGPIGQAAAMRATSRDLRRMSRDDSRWPSSQQNSDAGSRGPQGGPGRRPHPPAPSSGGGGSRGPASGSGSGAARTAHAPTASPASGAAPSAATSTASGAGAGAGAAAGGGAATAAGTAGASVAAGPAAPVVAGAVVASKAVASQRSKGDDGASGRRSAPPPASSAAGRGAGGSGPASSSSGRARASAPPPGRDTSRNPVSDNRRGSSDEPPPSAGRRATPPQG